MQKEFEFIIYKLHELLAVEQLEFHNKIWLSGSDASRSEMKQSELKYLISRLSTLALDVAGQRPKFTMEDNMGDSLNMNK